MGNPMAVVDREETIVQAVTYVILACPWCQAADEFLARVGHSQAVLCTHCSGTFRISARSADVDGFLRCRRSYDQAGS